MRRWLLGGGVLLLTLVSASLGAQVPTWTQKVLANGPPITGNTPFAMTYDASRGQVVLVGGYDYSLGNTNGTWVWDGGSWTLKNPVSSPPSRQNFAMTYDAARGQVVLFGGYDGSNRNDTWVWDGSNWSLKSSTNSPSPRQALAMTYDSIRGQVVLFGGYGGGTYYNDTWVWDGTNWTQKNPTNTPPPRVERAMVFDAARERVVMFGGNSGITLLNDTWVWDGTNWTQKSPSTSPTSRYQHAMAYDSAREQAVLFGGNDTTYPGDTWVWDGTDWTQKSPLNSPTPRVLHVMGYDEARAQVILFGGTDGSLRNDTWVWPNVTNSAGPRQALNDTGIDKYGDNTQDSLTSEPSTHPGQDARRGRDAAVTAGGIKKVGAGAKGFDFTKIANGGATLPATAQLGFAASDWACTYDNVTGLMWEVKVNDPTHLRHVDHVYSWYDTNPFTNGGSAGTQAAGVCKNVDRCDTKSIVADVNAEGLCGSSDWRLPTAKEIESLFHYGVPEPGPTIDLNYFPNTPPLHQFDAHRSEFWTSTPNAADSSVVWTANLGVAAVGNGHKNWAFRVLLVRRR